jgi:phage FluMu protein gp41
MAQLKVTLKHGLKVGEDTLAEVTLREVTAGDIIEAQDESEKLVYAADGGKLVPTLVASPTMVGVHVLRRQVARIGDMDGPLSLEQLKRLHPDDLNLLQAKADEMDGATEAEAASREVAQRGRGDGDGGGA